MQYFYCLLFTLASSCLLAQDAYYTNLLNQLEAEYDITGGTIISPTSEAQTAGSFYAWNTNPVVVTIEDQAFTQSVEVQIEQAGNNAWDAGGGLDNVATIDAGDVLLAVVWLKGSDAAVDNGTISFFFEENGDDYSKDFEFSIPLSPEWRQYLVPFTASRTYQPSEGKLGFHFAQMPQRVHIGGITLINYEDEYTVQELPQVTNLDYYDGIEPDAAWRASADDRIDELRRADMSVQVVDINGDPVPNAEVHIAMQEHEFAFGSAVVGCRFPNNPCANETYQEKVMDIDGNGHGFNWVVLENSLKWPSWENNWIGTPAQTAFAIEWLRERDIIIRGHTLVWPGWVNLPDDLQNNSSDPSYLINRINTHIETIANYPGIDGNIAEWDVLNEITTNQDIANALAGTDGYPTGREIYAEIFKKAKEEAPEATLYLNDYVTLSRGGNNPVEVARFDQYLQELIASGAPVEGLGFQGHINTLVSPEQILETLDYYAGITDAEFKITEFDMPSVWSDDIQQQYMADFLTTIFSHPRMTGFLMWGFWDGNHWLGNAPIFNEDWSVKPSGESFIQKVYNDWWTDETLTTDENGSVDLRAFKGKYTVNVTCADGTTGTMETDFTEDGALEVVCDMSLNTYDPQLAASLTLYPNPAVDYIYLEQAANYDLREANLQTMDGKMLKTLTAQQLQQPISVEHLAAGTYHLQIVTTDNKRATLTFVK